MVDSSRGVPRRRGNACLDSNRLRILATSAPVSAEFRGQSGAMPPGPDACRTRLHEIWKCSSKIQLPKLPVHLIQKILMEHLLCVGP